MFFCKIFRHALSFIGGAYVAAWMCGKGNWFFVFGLTLLAISLWGFEPIWHPPKGLLSRKKNTKLTTRKEENKNETE